MTGREFADLITGEGIPLVIANNVITDLVEITTNLVAVGIIIENCVFLDDVIFEEIDFNCGITFINCDLKKSLAINNCEAHGFNQTFNFFGHHLTLDNTKIDGLYFNGNNRIDRGVCIKNSCILNRLQVKSVQANLGSFSIECSTINSQFDIVQAEFKNHISVRDNSTINSKVRFENTQAGSFEFTESVFNKDVYLWSGKTNSIIFNDGVFYNEFQIRAHTISSQLTVIGTEFKKSVVFNLWDETNKILGKLSRIQISSAKFGEQFIINGNGNTIDGLVITASQKLEGAMYFNSCHLSDVQFYGDNYKSNIVFNHCKFNRLSFDFFSNYSTLSIISSVAFDEKSSITVAHSNLGKLHLFNVALNSFDRIQIHHSILTEIIVANVKWFSDYKLNSEVSETHHTYEQRKEIYRQLKCALEKQGNKIDALRFKALEMKSFKQEVFSKVKMSQRIFDIDRFLLWTGQTNDFGLNWFKPVLFAIAFSILFHFLIVVGVSNELSYTPNLSCPSAKETFYIVFYKHAEKLPQLMNPAHVLDRVFEGQKLPFLAHLFDYLLKILIAFFIFQTVSAFRKYIK